MSEMATRALRSVKGTRLSTKALLFFIAVVAIIGIGISTPASASTESTTISAAAASAATSTQLTGSSSLSTGAYMVPAAEATGNGEQPPSYWSEASKQDGNMFSACRYLTFCRWWSANQVPSQNVSFLSLAQLPATISAGIASIVYSIGSMIVFLIGLTLIIVSTIDLMSIAVFSADYLFAQFMSTFLGMKPGNPFSSIPTIGVMVIAILGLIAVTMVFPGFGQSSRGRFQTGIKSLAISLIAMIAFGIMATQALQNHSETASNPMPIASLGKATLKSPDEIAGNVKISEPSNWALGSPGWTVAMARQGAGFVQNFLTGVTSEVFSQASGFINNGQGTGSTCDVYIEDGMYGVYQETEAVGGNFTPTTSAGVLMSYDRLVRQVYFKNYSMSSGGGTPAGQNSWCRAVERYTNASFGEQIMISQKAGLYGSVTDTVADGDGNWKPSSADWDGKDGVTAYSFFRSSGDSKIDLASQMIWGGCIWTQGNSDAAFNTEWTGIVRANVDDFSWNPFQNLGNASAPGFDESAACSIKPDNSTNLKDWWGYEEDKGFFESGIGSLGAAPSFAKLAPSLAATDYFMSVQGFVPGVAFISAVIAIAILYFMAKFILPVALGASIAQFTGTAVLILAPLILIAYMIPVGKLRTKANQAVMTFLASIFVVTVIALILSLAFALSSIFQAMFALAFGMDSGIGGVLQSIMAALATFFAFFILKVAVSGLFGFDITNMKAALKFGAAGAAPLLEGMGIKTPFNPMDKDSWGNLRNRFKKDPEADDLLNDEKTVGNTKKGDIDPDLLKGDGSKADAAATAKDAGLLGQGTKALADNITGGGKTDAQNLLATGKGKNDLGELKLVKDEAAKGINSKGKDAVQDFRSILGDKNSQKALTTGKDAGLHSFLNSTTDGLKPSDGKIGNGLTLPTAGNSKALGALVPGIGSAAAGTLALTGPAAKNLMNAAAPSVGKAASQALGAGTIDQASSIMSIARQMGSGTVNLPTSPNAGSMSNADLASSLQGMGYDINTPMDVPQYQMPVDMGSMPLSQMDPEAIVRARMSMMADAFSSVATEQPSHMIPQEDMSNWSNLIGQMEPGHAEDFSSWTIQEQSRAAQIMEEASVRMGIDFQNMQVGQAMAMQEMAREAAIKAAAEAQLRGASIAESMMWRENGQSGQ